MLERLEIASQAVRLCSSRGRRVEIYVRCLTFREQLRQAKSGSTSIAIGMTVGPLVRVAGVQSRIGKIKQVSLPAEGAAQQQLGPRYPCQIVAAVANSRADLAPRRQADERQNPAVCLLHHDAMIALAGRGCIDLDQLLRLSPPALRSAFYLARHYQICPAITSATKIRLVPGIWTYDIRAAVGDSHLCIAARCISAQPEPRSLSSARSIFRAACNRRCKPSAGACPPRPRARHRLHRRRG